MTTPSLSPRAQLGLPVTGSEVDPVTAMGRALAFQGAAGEADSRGADVVLHEEQLRVSTERVPAERVRLIRRVVTETQMIPVQVRREILDIERTSLDGHAVDSDGPGTSSRVPVVMLLHEEVPVVSFEIRAAEQVTVSIIDVAGETAVRAELSSEQFEVIDVPPDTPRVV